MRRSMRLCIAIFCCAASIPVDLAVHPADGSQRWSHLANDGTATDRLPDGGEVYVVANDTQGYFYLQYAKNSTTDSSVLKEVVEVSNAGHGMTVVRR
jgi:hypothetical protein